MTPFSKMRQDSMPLRPKHLYPPRQSKSFDVGSLHSSEGTIVASSIGDNTTVISMFSAADQLEQKQTCSDDLVLVEAEGSAFKALIRRSQAVARFGKEQAEEASACACPGSSGPPRQTTLALATASADSHFLCFSSTEAAATSLPSSPHASERDSSPHPHPRITNAYSTLESRGVLAETSPFNLIRVWTLKSDQAQFLYDCICNARLPDKSLRNIKRHVFRHSTDYICPVCKQEFRNHWSFNAHQKIHPVRSPVDIPTLAL